MEIERENPCKERKKERKNLKIFKKEQNWNVKRKSVINKGKKKKEIMKEKKKYNNEIKLKKNKIERKQGWKPTKDNLYKRKEIIKTMTERNCNLGTLNSIYKKEVKNIDRKICKRNRIRRSWLSGWINK